MMYMFLGKILAYLFVLCVIYRLLTDLLLWTVLTLSVVGLIISLRHFRRFPGAWPAWKRYYRSLINRRLMEREQETNIMGPSYHQFDRIDNLTFRLLNGLGFVFRYWAIVIAVTLALTICVIIDTYFAYAVALIMIGFSVFYEFKMLRAVPHEVEQLKQEVYGAYSR